MPFIAAISKIDFPYKVSQKEVKEYALKLFSASFPQANRLQSIFDNTEIESRNFCKPLDKYTSLGSFTQRNGEYVAIALEYSIRAIEDCIISSGVARQDITDIIFVSTTGLSTPSLDALIVNRMRLSENINRIPIFGLGCAGGVSGFAKANTLAKANPDAVVLLVAVELCSLTFLSEDFSKSNFVASSLFSDGVAACIIKGDNHKNTAEKKVNFVASRSKLYYDTLDVMGWEFLDIGFKVVFSQDIPTIITNSVNNDVSCFLSKQKITLGDIKNFVFHPGGKKVLEAYKTALNAEGDFLKDTREVMHGYGNMSSVTVLYVLEKFYREGYQNGYGLMAALGPGFSSEIALLEMTGN